MHDPLPHHLPTHSLTYNGSINGCNIHLRSNEAKQKRLDKLPKDEESSVDNVLRATTSLPTDASHKGYREDGEGSCSNEAWIVVEYHSFCPKEGKKCQANKKSEPVSDNGAFFLGWKEGQGGEGEGKEEGGSRGWRRKI